MLGLEVGSAKIYVINENTKLILRKEVDGFYYLVHPLTFEMIKLNETGGYILDRFLHQQRKEDIINDLVSMLQMPVDTVSEWVDEFERYLKNKKLIY